MLATKNQLEITKSSIDSLICLDCIYVKIVLSELLFKRYTQSETHYYIIICIKNLN